jgi:four helix bundle protein
MSKDNNLIVKLSFEFAIEIIALYKELIKAREYVISKQMLRSATSIGANIEEAQAAQSYKDFISKMSIASKEARETKYWLKLLSKGKMTQVDLENYIDMIEAINNILTSIVKTSSDHSKSKILN